MFGYGSPSIGVPASRPLSHPPPRADEYYRTTPAAHSYPHAGAGSGARGAGPWPNSPYEEEHKYAHHRYTPTSGSNPFSLVDAHRHHANRADRPKPTLADACNQALNAHPHAVSGFITMNRINANRLQAQARTSSAGSPSEGGPLFAFSRPPPSVSAVALVNKTSMSIARVLARAEEMKSQPMYDPRDRDRDRQQRHRLATHPFSSPPPPPPPAPWRSASAQNFSTPQPYIRSDALRNAGADAMGFHQIRALSPPTILSAPNAHTQIQYSTPSHLHRDASPTPTYNYPPPISVISPPPKPTPSPIAVFNAAHAANAIHSPAPRKIDSTSHSIDAMEADAARARAARRAAADAADRQQAHELELRRAARRQEELEEQSRIEADRAYKRGLIEGSDTARRHQYDEQVRMNIAAGNVMPAYVSPPPPPPRGLLASSLTLHSSPSQPSLDSDRRRRREAADKAAREADEELARKRAERRKRLEEEDRLADEAAARKREERKRKEQEEIAAEERRRAARVPTYALPTAASRAAEVDSSSAALARDERRRKLQAETDAAEQEAARLRAERRQKAHDQLAAEEAEAERKRAARMRDLEQAEEEERRRKARQMLELEEAEAEKRKEAQRKAMEQAEQDAQRKLEADIAARKKKRDEEDAAAAAAAAALLLVPAAAVASTAVATHHTTTTTTTHLVEQVNTVKTTVHDTAAAAGQAPITDADPTPAATATTTTDVTSVASLDLVRTELKKIRAYLQDSSVTLLPRDANTDLISEPTEKELSVMLDCGRPTSDPLALGRTTEYLLTLQGHRLGYTSVIELCKDILELRAGREPSFGIRLYKDDCMKVSGGRAFASWIQPSDRDKLFEYLANPETTLFTVNVKLSNRTLDSLLTECGSADMAIQRCSDFCFRSIQFSTSADLLAALRALRIWKAGNGNGAALVSESVMTFFSPNSKGDPASIQPIMTLIEDQPPLTTTRTQTTQQSDLQSLPVDPSVLTPKSKLKANFVAPSWITASDRDRLFEYLASGECTLFSANVKLSNRTLNMLLAEGGTVDKTIELCKLFNSQGRQFTNAQALVAAIKAAVVEEKVLQPPPEDVVLAVASPDSLLPNAPAPSALPLPLEPAPAVGSPAPAILPPGVVPPPVKASWITDVERDGLFAYLSDPNCALFSANVKLSNRTLDAFLTEGGSLIETIAYCKQLNDSGNQYATTTDLLEAVKLMRIQREKAIQEAMTARNTARQTESQEPKPEASVTATVTPAPAVAVAVANQPPFVYQTAPWITPSDRDKLFDYLASVDCLLFAVNVKLSNKALDSLLVEGESADAAVELCTHLNTAGKQYNTVGELITGMHDEKAARAQASAATSVAPTPVAVAVIATGADADEEARKLAEKQAARKAAKKQAAEAAAAAAAAAATNTTTVVTAAPAPAAANPPPPAQSNAVAAGKPIVSTSVVLTSATITPGHRDALFAILADPETQLFNQDVKLNNKALDRMLIAGTTFELTAMYLNEFHHSGLQFSSIDDLCAAIDATHQAAVQHKAQLLEYMRRNQFHLLTASAFPEGAPAVVTDGMVDALYLHGHSGLYTLSHVERVQSLNQRSESIDQLAERVQKVDTDMNAQHDADTRAVEAYLAQPGAEKLFPDLAQLSPVDHIHLAASGRQSLYAPSRSVEYMQNLSSRGLSYSSLPDLMAALHNGISNPNTARSVVAAPLTARNRLDDENEFDDDDDMKAILKVDLASQAVARSNASKGDAKAPTATSIPVPTLPALPKETETRRHDAAMARIAQDLKEDEDRIAARKTPKKAQLVASFRAHGLPKMDLIGSTDGYLEFYRYRAYQDQVTSVIWDQIKSNLWQKVYRTSTVKDSLNPTWPTVVWSVDPLCSGEYDRPILIKAFDWNKHQASGVYIGELVTTLGELLEHATSQKPFEILNEAEAKKNPRSYKNSGMLFIQKAEVRIPRSVVAVRTLVSAVQSKVSPTSDLNTKVLNPPLTKSFGHLAGMGVGQYVYSECLVWLTLKATKLDKMDTFGKSDPLVQVMRVNPSIALKDGMVMAPPTMADYVQVFESEVIEHNLDPEWRPFVLTMKELCTGNVLCPLLVRVFDWNKAGSNELIGEFTIDLYTLLCNGPSNDGKYPLLNPIKVGRNGYTNSGILHAKVKLLSKYELASKDPALVEQLVQRAPFLLGWQPGLELKGLQNKGKSSTNTGDMGVKTG